MASQAPGAETAASPRPASTTVPAATADVSAHALLAEAGRRLSGSLNVRRRLRAIAELAVVHLADSAVVVGPPKGPGRAMVRLASGGKVAELASHEDDLAQVPGLLAVPLPGTATPGGALLMARRAGRGEFDAHDRALAVTFALHAGAAVSAASHFREQSEAMAALQAELLPPELSSTDRMELAGSYQPAVGGLLVGGDFYDVFPPAGATGSFLVLLGDVWQGCRGRSPDGEGQADTTGAAPGRTEPVRRCSTAPADGCGSPPRERRRIAGWCGS
jgi:hypothetical protein